MKDLTAACIDPGPPPATMQQTVPLPISSGYLGGQDAHCTDASYDAVDLSKDLRCKWAGMGTIATWSLSSSMSSFFSTTTAASIPSCHVSPFGTIREPMPRIIFLCSFPYVLGHLHKFITLSEKHTLSLQDLVYSVMTILWTTTRTICT